MGNRKQVQISVIDPRFDAKVGAVALHLGPMAYARGKPSRSRVLAILLEEAWAETPQGRAEKLAAETANREARRRRIVEQGVQQNAVFGLAIHAPEAWTSVGGIDREWVRHRFDEDHVKAIATPDQSKVAILLSIGEGCSNLGTMKSWIQDHYDGGGLRGIANLLSDRYVPVAFNTIKRFCDSQGIVLQRRGPRAKA